MKLHHHHLPSMSISDEEEHQRRATIFLSNWINQNSFLIDSSSRRSCSSSSSDDDDNTIDDCSGSISNVSLSPDFLEEDDNKEEEEDLGISMQQLSICDDDLEVYEDDNDEFHASSSNAHQHTDNHYFGSSIRSRSLHAPGSSIPAWHSKHSHNHQRGGEHRIRSNSASGYLPSSLRDVVHDVTNNSNNKSQAKQQQIASCLSWRDHRGITGKYTGQVNDRMQPHGSGALIYKDGSAETPTWKNGIPVQFWSPEGSSRKQQQPLLSTNTSNGSSTSSSNHTYLPHLDLGNVGTSQDMIIESSRSIALEKMNSLQIHDFTFVLRSDGQWTYAIIADRQDNTIRFVVDTIGDSKTLSKKHWSTSIRLVNPDEACGSGTRSSNSKRSKKACNRK